jgi:hypothetical protein
MPTFNEAVDVFPPAGHNENAMIAQIASNYCAGRALESRRYLDRFER